MMATRAASIIAPAVRFTLQPRLIQPQKAARWLGRTLAQFEADLPALLLEGFPRACNVTGNYDLHAIEAWQDRRSGIATGSRPAEDHDAIIRARLDALG
jgi:hypothetical protein